jgi:deltex-like protein
VRRVDSAPSTVPISKIAKSKTQKSPVALPSVTIPNNDEEDEGFVVVKKKKLKSEAKTSSSAIEVNLTLDSPYPDASEIAPVWDYLHPTSQAWTKLATTHTKMVEGLSKRSAVFTLQVPGLGGFQVTLATMMMKSTTPGQDTQIRRTPPLKNTSASPILTAVSQATSSSAPSPASKKKKKALSGDTNHESHLFEVEAELIAKCKKATNWKSVSFKDGEKLLKDSTCVICCDDFGDTRSVVHLSQCGTHYFHENCIAASFKPGFISCPVCQTIYGIRTGTQPKGTMKHTTSSSEKLAGYEKYGCITINYNFKDGIQEAHHPSPGSTYAGTSRTAYLPDSPEGRNVLKLLQLAFERQLVFTIGTSVTTGASNCVIWNGIHHKTSQAGGSTNFGYPDETYLARVSDELKAKGVTFE